jgi:hypothetical protein
MALALVGGVYVAFGGREGVGRGAGPLLEPNPTPVPIPDFAFSLSKVRPIATGKKQDAMAIAHSAASRIQQTLDRLYMTGFIDPNAWGAGRYGDLWRLFASDAVGTARADDSTLTLGSNAGKLYSTVAPHVGQLRVQVLMDKLGHPSTAVAIVHFAARAVTKGGARNVIKSAGQYFLRPSTRGWLIYGYDIHRDDSIIPNTGTTT